MARKKKTEPAVEAAKTITKYIAANHFIAFYYQPEAKDPKGLIGPYQIVDAEEVNDEWLSYHLDDRKGETLFSKKEFFSKM